MADNWFRTTWQRHAPAALVRNLPARRRRKYIRARLRHGDVDAAMRLISDRDPFRDGALWDALDPLIERRAHAEIPALLPLAQMRPAFDQAIFAVLSDLAGDGTDACAKRLRAMGADTQFGPFERMCARAWACFLEMPRLAAPEASNAAIQGPPIMQFWDQRDIPGDVRAALDAWRDLAGPRHTLLHGAEARAFLGDHYGDEALHAYTLCPHPAIQADYLRLGWLAVHGGVWIDADSRMCPDFTAIWHDLADRTVLWFNARTGHFLNGFLAAPPGSPLMQTCFREATQRIARDPTAHPYTLAGPGVLTDAIINHWNRGQLPDVANVTTGFVSTHIFQQLDAEYKRGGSWQSQRADSQ